MYNKINMDDHQSIMPHSNTARMMLADREWMQLLLENGVPANQHGIEFLLSPRLRSVNVTWRNAIDRVLGNHTWMAPSVLGGFHFAENELPLALHTAHQALVTRNPMAETDTASLVFRQSLATIIAGMNRYRSDLPTQARIMTGLITLFKDHFGVQHVRKYMDETCMYYPSPIADGLELVRAVMWAMRVHSGEYDLLMLCLGLLRLICRSRFQMLHIGIGCGVVPMLLEIMRANLQHRALLIASYRILMDLCGETLAGKVYLVDVGGIPILRKVMLEEMGFAEQRAGAMCASFLAARTDHVDTERLYGRFIRDRRNGSGP